MVLGVASTASAYYICQHDKEYNIPINDEAENIFGHAAGGAEARACINLNSFDEVTNSMNTSSSVNSHCSFGYCYKAGAIQYNHVTRARIRDLRVDPGYQSNWVSENANTSYKYVYNVQHALKSLGYNPGTLDGVWGTNTKNAIVAFQTRNSLGKDGVVGPTTWYYLSTRGKRP